jgi:hypothetical protein
MAIDTDKLKNKGVGNSTQPNRFASTPAPEGGGDMTLALTSTVQGQATQLVQAAQAAQISIDHASTHLAAYFTEVMSGQALLNATLTKTAANLEAMGGPVAISADVPEITVELPRSSDFGQTRQKFLGMFTPAPSYPNPFREIAPAADEVGTDDNV